MYNKLEIGIIGCGAIGSQICRAIDTERINAEIIAICDIDNQKVINFIKTLQHSKPRILSLDKTIKNANLILECACVDIVPTIVQQCIDDRKDLMVMSVGGLNEELIKNFSDTTANLYVPSGAICGIDGILAACQDNIESITLVTRKPPSALAQSRFVIENNINLSEIQKETILFSGTCKEAIRLFPQNINVSYTIRLASSGIKNFNVAIIADPYTDKNIHKIDIVGSFGKISITVENVPSEFNPKTSAMAFYSAVALLKKICSNVKIGT